MDSGIVIFVVFVFCRHTARTLSTSGTVTGGGVTRKPGNAWLNCTPAIHVTCSLEVERFVCGAFNFILIFDFFVRSDQFNL